MGRFYKLPPKFAVDEDKANSPLSHCDSSGRRIFEDGVFKIKRPFSSKSYIYSFLALQLQSVINYLISKFIWKKPRFFGFLGVPDGILNNSNSGGVSREICS